MAKPGGKFCLVYYYVPEDKDDPEFPNAFGVNNSVDDLKVPEIRKLFPLEGEYIFRFKAKVGTSNVWMDIKEESRIPLFNGRIIMKATRVSWERRENKAGTTSEPAREQARTTSNAPYGASYTEAPSKPQNSGPQQSAQNGSYGIDDFNLLTTAYQSNPSSNPSSTTNAHSKAQAHDSHDLLDFGNSHSQGNGNNYKANQEANKKSDLLSFDNLF